ncbi:alpha/beta hydrolase family protein [Paenibacillus sp. 2RAB27]|uniref:alpha/beta hydrolase family protein n=1 Tax=Paenibacillus sp. 2RAB27 TaxID=3232991 RepID=UPI003F9CDC8E
MENEHQNRENNHPPLPWNLESLYQATQAVSVPEMDDDQIKAIMYEALPYQGKQTRVFAYYGIPDAALGAKVPGVVLVHGGGGTAFKEWVQLWNDRGYAAIAMDLEGHIATSKTTEGVWPEHTWSGPSRQGEFADYASPVEDQWMFHAVANVILAHSFLRSFENVASDQIGLHGISWGGIVAGIVAGVDERFSYAIPVYGCGYLFEATNKYGQSFQQMPPEYAKKIKQLWDPSAYFDRITIPMLWVNWSHDPHFPLHLFSKSYQASRKGSVDSSLSIHFGLRHSHAAGWKAPEIYAFADHITKGGHALPQILREKVNVGEVIVVFRSELPIVKAELRYATQISDWFEIEWLTKEAHIEWGPNEIRALLEENTSACFIQITDERGYIVSTPVHVFGHQG